MRTYPPHQPDPADILRSMGCPAESGRNLDEAAHAARIALRLARPVAAYKRLEPTRKLRWPHLSNLDDEIYIAAATIGHALEREVSKLTARGNLAEALMLDAAGSVAAEAAADLAEVDIVREAALTGKKTGRRSSPGYGLFPLRDQDFFARFLPFPELGLTLTGSSMLVPEKSVTFVIAAAVGNPADLRSKLLCAGCRAESCARRSNRSGAGCFKPHRRS